MITLQELYKNLDELLQQKPISDYCVNGVQVKGCHEIKKIVTAVTASLATIERAVEMGAQALIVHHGMFWKGDSQVIEGSRKEKLKALLKKDMSLLAYHLPLDAHKEVGNNWRAAKEMGWEDLEPFGLYNGTYIGVKGRLPKQSREKFQKKIEEYYNHPATTALGGKKDIETVGLISGGAYKSIEEAGNEGLDCFITGNFDEPAWHLAHEYGVNFYALGHSATEKIGPKALVEHLKGQFSNIDCEFLDIENPF